MAGLLRVQPPSLELGVRVVRVDGLEQEQLEERGGGSLFLRYYVPAGDGRRRLRVDTREVPCAGDGDLRWGELARFQRWGGGGAAGGIAFELRWRPRPSSSSGLVAALLGAGGARVRPSSRVLARAELPWADVSSAAAAQPAERWLTLSQVGRELRGCKAPKLLVEVKAVRHAAVASTERTSGGGMTQCCRAAERCGQCGWVGSEEDMFLAATFSQQY
ncbi:uncharacterized protein [Miscanthus floridulus]|uniref:uncharacterized protein n=1 Tax=Miscanthus floridulus TaxID=154761 RepID=UPI0034573C89